MTWSRKHVITIESMSREEILSVLDVAGFYRRECMKAGRAPQYDTLKGFTAVNMFFENSTRTRISFELAEKRLGMTSIDFNAPASSLSKGESFEDTLMTMNAMNVDVIVIRHPMNGSAQRATEYVDGSVIGQLGNPDMRTPIAHALAWPERIDAGVRSLDLFDIARLDFERPDLQRFPCLALAFSALRAGGAAPATLNAANEEAVEAFLTQRIGFLDIARVIEACLERSPDFAVDSLDAVFAADAQARDRARTEIRNLSAA